MEETRAHFEPLRAMVDEHTALGHDLLELHEEFLAMCLQDLSQTEHRAQTADFLRRELEILSRAASLQQALLQHFFKAHIESDAAGEPWETSAIHPRSESRPR